ncbi:hypothetical protein Tco_0718582 [Tanacetum coccineum]
MIQRKFITLSLSQFGQIFRIPYNGQAVFTNEWDLASLAYSQETEGPYHTNLSTPNEICRFLQLERTELNRTIKSTNVILTPNQILTKELRQDMNHWEEHIRENVFGLGGHRDHLPASLAHMLYCIVVEEQYNLVYFFVKRIEFALKQTRKPQSDRGKPKSRHSVSSSSAHHYISSSHQEDDDDNEGTSRASTPSPTLTLTLFNHLITKNMTFLLLLNKMIIFSSSDKLPCSIKRNKSMRKLEVDSNHSGRHCEESLERKRNKDVE